MYYNILYIYYIYDIFIYLYIIYLYFVYTLENVGTILQQCIGAIPDSCP